MADKGIVYSKIAGVSHPNSDGESRQEIIQKYCRAGMPLTLIAEPDNPYSDTAIGIWIDTNQGRKQLGYVRDTDLDDQLFAILQGGGKVECRISEVTGGGNKTLGVNIRIQIIVNAAPAVASMPMNQVEAKEPPKEAIGKIGNSGRKGKIDRRIWFILGGIALGVLLICGIINALSPKTAPGSNMDLDAVNTHAVQSAWAPITQTSAAAIVSATRTAAAHGLETVIAAPTRTPLPTSTPEATATATLTSAQRIPLYAQIDPRELTTYPNNHTGELIAVWGKVFNINGDQELQIWVAGGYDAAYIQMAEPFSGLYEDDVISVYGTVAGENCGTNAYGAEVCQPLLIDAFYVKQQ